LYVALYEAARKREEKRMKELQEAVMQIGRTLYRVGNHPSSIIKGIKCALSCEGVCDDFMAEPFHRFRAAERNRVQQHLEEIGAELKRLKV
jgi:4-hydroxy-tetrahydrodipicolinate synthase